MPRAKQKRGRRAEAKAATEAPKRKREDETVDGDTSKRPKTADETNASTENHDYVGEDYIPLEENNRAAPSNDIPFYGLLDPEEQEYFSQANQTLELDQFEDDEDRGLFIESVFEEASGKELKIACSQSCSRLMEKLISMSTTKQIKRLFNIFSDHFLHLIQHRFASHCCECLFVRATPMVTSEIKSSKGSKNKENGGNRNKQDEDNDSETDLSVTELFLRVIVELQGNLGYLLTESFASHTIRLLLLILAGEPLGSPSNGSLIASRKKENSDVISRASMLNPSLQEKREVPPSFVEALHTALSDLSAGLNTTYLRALTTHPVGCPVLQVILSVELTSIGKAQAKNPNSIFRKLVPDDSLEEEETSAFLTGLFYDPVSSRLLETIVRCSPGKFFRAFYKVIIRDRVASLARNEIASYVVIRVLERLSKEDLQTAMISIIPELSSLIDRSRVNVVKTLIDRAVVRGVDISPLAQAIKTAYGDDDFVRLQNILHITSDTAPKEENPTNPNNSPKQLHGSLLAQAMLQAPGPLAELVQTSLLAAPSNILIEIAKQPAASRTLQESLTASKSNQHFRRQIVAKFFGHITELAVHNSGSHVADILWQATSDLIFLKKRLAEELQENEGTLRESFFGRAVWRNWSMDLYKRKRGEWTSKAKEQLDPGAKAPSKLDIARARYAASKERAQQSREKSNSATRDKKAPLSGANLSVAR